MVFKIKPLLLKFDFIGFVPQFRIMEDTRYTSFFSSLLSIIIILFSISFVSYSFTEYLHQNPKVEYYKNNDYDTNKTFTISNSLFMFVYSFLCYSNLSLDGNITITFEDPLNMKSEQLNYETCEIGKNIDIKYKNIIEELKNVAGFNQKDLLCLNFNNKEYTLYSHPSFPIEFEKYLRLRLESECKKYNLILYLIAENDYLDHSQKDNPFVPHFKFSSFILANEKINLVYNYQYIKYESDNGIIISDKKITNGTGVSSSDSFDKTSEDLNNIVSIDFKLNNTNYDFYRRTFKKFQSFLAEVMSLID